MCWPTDDQFFFACSKIFMSAGNDKLLCRDRYAEKGVELITC